MRVSFTFIFIVAGLTSACSHNPTILGKSIPRDAACPAAGKFCSQNIGDRAAISLTKEARYIKTLADGSPDYWDVLGREYTKSGSLIVNFCGNVTTNPFETYAGLAARDELVINKVASNTVDFKKVVKSTTTIGAGVDIGAIISRAGVTDPAQKKDATEALSAGLEKIETEENKLVGTFEFAYIDPTVVAMIKAKDTPPAFKECRDALRAPKAPPIIVSMTLMRIEKLNSSNDLISNFDAGLDAALAGKVDAGAIANLKVEFKRDIDQDFATIFKPTYQIMSIGGWSGS